MKRKLVAIVGSLLVVLLLAPGVMAEIATISLAEVQELVKQKPEKGGYLLIDARPEIKYFAGHLPYAVSLPKQELTERLDELPADKSTKLVFYCGGLKCKLSTQSAEIAKQHGYTNVFAFREGIPAWEKAEIPWVNDKHIKMTLNDPKRVALVVDARPSVKYNKGTIPGAMNIPWPQFEQMQGLLPSDKELQLIFFCGGLKCDLSHKSAAAARQLGYQNVVSYAYGWPDWKKKSKRGFAMVNPKDGAAPVAKAEAVVVEGEIPADDFLKMLEKPPADLLIVDVRPAEEYAEGHLPGAINILDETVLEHRAELEKYAQVVFYCNTGSRAAVAYYEADGGGLKNCLFLNREVTIAADGAYKIN